MLRNHSSDLLLVEMVNAARQFERFVKQHNMFLPKSDPKYVRFRRAIANASGKAKSIKEDQEREAIQAKAGQLRQSGA